MRITILDPGLISKSEHSYALNTAITRGFQALGVRTDVYAFRLADPHIQTELECVLHFENSLYEGKSARGFESKKRLLVSRLTRSPVNLDPSEFRTSKDLNASFERDLEKLPFEVWDAGNIVLFPGLFQHQVLGLARFMRRNAGEIQAKVVCQLMFPPTWTPWGRIAKRGRAIYRQAFRLTSGLTNKTLFFATENEHVAQIYARLGVTTHALPVPIKGSLSNKNDNGRICIGFFGYSKSEKGFHLLPEAIKICKDARLDLDFSVQIHHHGQEPETIRAAEELGKISSTRLLRGALSAEDYAAETAKVDIMLLPYDPVLFGLRGSGIFVESASVGRAIVAAKGIWAACCIEAGEAAGETFEPYDSASLAAAILVLCTGLSRAKTQAAERASDFARKYSVNTYIENLFAITGVSPPLQYGRWGDVAVGQMEVDAAPNSYPGLRRAW